MELVNLSLSLFYSLIINFHKEYSAPFILICFEFNVLMICCFLPFHKFCFFSFLKNLKRREDKLWTANTMCTDWLVIWLEKKVHKIINSQWNLNEEKINQNKKEKSQNLTHHYYYVTNGQRSRIISFTFGNFRCH